MSFMQVTPGGLAAAAAGIAGIGADIGAANTAAALPTTGVAAAAADEISTQVAALFSDHALAYQQISAAASEFHDSFVQALGTGANAYTSAESAAARTLASSAAAAPAAVIPVSVATSIESSYITYEPWVQYGVELFSYVDDWLPYIGLLGPQINFLYDLGEPIVQATLFNTLDWLAGTVLYDQAVSNIQAATAASINNFVNLETDWIRWLLPPLPPIA
ncbi:PE family protein [Mycobacterium sp.]|uniref:PE family protein n=1 Tax=Mycobacterium sp. TaxID=1785 RepID=UPI003A8955DA